MRSNFDDCPSHIQSRLAQVVATLLHDWIKYMEMRLLSIDWDNPPPRLERLTRRAILETRKRGNTCQSVREIWEREKGNLLSFDYAPASSLTQQLEHDVERLEMLVEWPHDRLLENAAEVDDWVRSPGRRLRLVRDALEQNEHDIL